MDDILDQAPQELQQESHQEQQQAAVHPRRRLGRGLDALLGSSGGGENSAEDDADPPRERYEPDPPEVPVDRIERNPFQPRVDFDSATLEELSFSIAQKGVLQPVLVRRQGRGYQLIAGERRLQAAKIAGLTTIPVRILTMEDRDVAEAALEENLQRDDLNAIEKALAFQACLERFGGTIEELASRLSMQRATISNFLRLLELPEPVRAAVRRNGITSGHARALLPLQFDADAQWTLCERIQNESLTVRRTEEEVRAILEAREANDPRIDEPADTVPFDATAAEGEKPSAAALTNHVKSLAEQLTSALGAKVEIRLKGKERGKVVVHFASNDQFERIVKQLRPAA
ncbi:MAG: ParB/RepB/Spo0J family partition protein [Planctomycetaceae bacterium]